MLPEFKSFTKIPRLSREIVITEKIDGTNACIYIDETTNEMLVGSRTRWITPQSDNFGFAAWVEQNKEELYKLGPGYHYGEWWGKGIQRGYGLNERRFSLFNISRWISENPLETGYRLKVPNCCYVRQAIFILKKLSKKTNSLKVCKEINLFRGGV